METIRSIVIYFTYKLAPFILAVYIPYYLACKIFIFYNLREDNDTYIPTIDRFTRVPEIV